MPAISAVPLVSGAIGAVPTLRGTLGGAVSGAEWTVAYEVDGYVYTITNVVADHAIVVAQASTTALYVKSNGAWVAVSAAYVKANGAWAPVALDSAFDSTKRYRRSDA